MNDEFRMTNDEISTKPEGANGAREFLASGFGVRIYFVIRASPFVI
jgi:hypothetical protein